LFCHAFFSILSLAFSLSLFSFLELYCNVFTSIMGQLKTTSILHKVGVSSTYTLSSVRTLVLLIYDYIPTLCLLVLKYLVHTIIHTQYDYKTFIVLYDYVYHCLLCALLCYLCVASTFIYTFRWRASRLLLRECHKGQG